MNLKIFLFMLLILISLFSLGCIDSGMPNSPPAYVNVNINGTNDTLKMYIKNNTDGGYVVYAVEVNSTVVKGDFGYFRELNVSNNSIYIGDVKLSANEEGLNVSANLSANYYYGSGKYLTDINLSNINGTSTFYGPVSIYGKLYMFDLINTSEICLSGDCRTTWPTGTVGPQGPQGPPGPAGPSLAPGNNTVIEYEDCDNNCTTVIEREDVGG